MKIKEGLFFIKVNVKMNNYGTVILYNYQLI